MTTNKNNARNATPATALESLAAAVAAYNMEGNATAAGTIVENDTSRRDARAALKKAAAAANETIAAACYAAAPLLDILRAGEVPAVTVTYDKDGAAAVEKTTARPTVKGLAAAGLIPADAVEKCTAARDITAALNMPGAEKPSRTAANKALAAALEAVTAGKIRTRVSTTVREDFERFVIKRGKKIGTRETVTAATACDLVIEYAYMGLNGQTTVKLLTAED